MRGDLPSCVIQALSTIAAFCVSRLTAEKGFLISLLCHFVVLRFLVFAKRPVSTCIIRKSTKTKRDPIVKYGSYFTRSLYMVNGVEVE